MSKQLPTKADGAMKDLAREAGRKEVDKFTTSIRITRATKAAVEWTARIRGVSLNSVYLHAVAQLAEATKKSGMDFESVYHPNDGVWWCRLLLLGITTWDEESRRVELVTAHMPFFFSKVGKDWLADEKKIAALWPHIDYLTDHWHKIRDMDAWATGEKMSDMLRQTKIKPPVWGPNAEIDR